MKSKELTNALIDKAEKLKKIRVKLETGQHVSTVERRLCGELQSEEIIGQSEEDRFRKIQEAAQFL